MGEYWSFRLEGAGVDVVAGAALAGVGVDVLAGASAETGVEPRIGRDVEVDWGVANGADVTREGSPIVSETVLGEGPRAWAIEGSAEKGDGEGNPRSACGVGSTTLDMSGDKRACEIDGGVKVVGLFGV